MSDQLAAEAGVYTTHLAGFEPTIPPSQQFSDYRPTP